MSHIPCPFSMPMLTLQFAVLWSRRMDCLVGLFGFAMFCIAVSFSGELDTPHGWINTGWLGILITDYAQMLLLVHAGRDRCDFFQAQNRLTQWCVAQAAVCTLTSALLIALWNLIGIMRFQNDACFLQMIGIMTLFTLVFSLTTFTMLQPRILRFSSHKKLALLFVISLPWILTAYLLGIHATHAIQIDASPFLPLTALVLLASVLFCLCATFFYTQARANPTEDKQDQLKDAP